MRETGFEDLLRELAPQVLGAVVRRYGHFDAAEDAVQEALLAASLRWPQTAVPADPRAWLIQVAANKLTDQLRSEQARRRREDTMAVRVPLDSYLAPAADLPRTGDQDDTLVLLLMCCHPVLAEPVQVALTLRAVGGLTTEEIAHAFLVPEETMRKRITRAKQRIKASGVPFRMPPAAELDARVRAVLQVLYLIFNEGYTATAGPALVRADLTAEAIRLGRILRNRFPAAGEVAGLLALMLLTDARRSARLGADGLAVPLAEQDRGLWDRAAIAEGVSLVTWAMSESRLGPYQVQAAIAAVHDEASRAEETDWRQILALYDLLERVEGGSSNPVVRLNRAVAVAMVHGPAAGLAAVEELASDSRLGEQHRLNVARAHLLELAGDLAGAMAHYRAAAGRAGSLPERRYLLTRASRLEGTLPA
ncbi:RNA polymerase sigma factor [Flindersiella endophytica]